MMMPAFACGLVDGRRRRDPYRDAGGLERDGDRATHDRHPYSPEKATMPCAIGRPPIT